LASIETHGQLELYYYSTLVVQFFRYKITMTETLAIPTSYLTKQERARRKASIDNARGSARLEVSSCRPRWSRSINGSSTAD